MMCYLRVVKHLSGQGLHATVVMGPGSQCEGHKLWGVYATLPVKLPYHRGSMNPFPSPSALLPCGQHELLWIVCSLQATSWAAFCCLSVISKRSQKWYRCIKSTRQRRIRFKVRPRNYVQGHTRLIKGRRPINKLP